MASKSTETTVQSKRKSSAEILRERKVSAYLEQISQHEEMMNLMKAERDALSGASILGIPVSHRRFGQGTVTGQDAQTITVQFAADSKRFCIPTAFFDGFLKTEDPAVNARLTRYQEIDSQINEVKHTISAADHAIQLLRK